MGSLKQWWYVFSANKSTLFGGILPITILITILGCFSLLYNNSIKVLDHLFEVTNYSMILKQNTSVKEVEKLFREIQKNPNITPVEQVEKLQREPIGMAFCSVLDIWGDFVEGNFLVTDSGDKDFLYEPTERGLLPVDWTRQPTVFIPLQLTDQELPDSRQALKKVLDRYKQKKLTPVVATELEFYLHKQNKQGFTPPLSPIQKEN